MCLFDSIFEWLEKWQELVGAILGAGVLAFTVWITLGSERRRRIEEGKSMRIALGAEFRQFAERALAGCQEVIKHLASAPITQISPTLTPVALANMARFPEPVIYPNCAQSLGALGEQARHVVFFFAQVSMVRDCFRAITSEISDDPTVTVPMEQIFDTANSLLNAGRAAVKAMPAFAGTPQSEGDADFAQAFADEVRKFIPQVKQWEVLPAQSASPGSSDT